MYITAQQQENTKKTERTNERTSRKANHLNVTTIGEPKVYEGILYR